MAYRSRFFAGGAIHTLPPELVFPLDYEDPSAAGASIRAAHRRRYERRKANTVGRKYNLAEVAERDGHRCHICKKPVDMSLSGRDPWGPTADHLIPVASNGGDDPENIALAHRDCNIRRGVGGVAQLRLVG